MQQYRAFISYRHLEPDRRWARWLIERLETFRTPRALVKSGTPARIGHLFRDDDEIPASHDLSHQIEDALTASQFLIVVCSRQTAASRWVRREIEFFKSLGRGDRIFALLVDGEPSEAFPPELLHLQEGVDSEPIAADVRPRSDEKPAATRHRALLRIAAGLLGVSFDDLARRDHRRRVRARRLWGSLAATLLVALAAGGVAYWNYNRVRLDYYAAMGTRWGVPYGIGPLSKSQAARRNAIYEIAVQRGAVIDVRRINGSGGPEALAGDEVGSESLEQGIAEIRLPVASDHAAQLDYYGATGQMIRIERYFWQPDGAASVSVADATGAALALDAAHSDLAFDGPDASGITQKSQIAQYGLEFDANGYLTRRLYRTVWGAPAPDSRGSFGRVYSHTPRGQIASYHEVDMAGRLLVGRTGIAEVRRLYGDDGLLRTVQWRDERGALIANPQGYAQVTFAYNAQGNSIEERFHDAAGRPAPRSDTGAAILKAQYDANGNQTAVSYFSADGKPVDIRGFAVAGYTARHDDKGRVLEISYFGTDGKPILRRDEGFARLDYRHDAQGNILQTDYRGLKGEPVLDTRTAMARLTQSYDANGHMIAEHYFGLHGEPVLSKTNALAARIWTFDGRGHVTNCKNLGLDGRLAPDKTMGVAQQHWSYDDRGNLVGESSFDPGGRLIPRKDTGVARSEWTFDDRGNASEVRNFAPGGKPVAGRDGWASVSLRFDARGNMVEQRFFGADGRPATIEDGYARSTRAFDGRGFMIHGEFWGVDGRPALSKSTGIARADFTFDARGNIVAGRYSGLHGEPVLRTDNKIAAMKARYDARGNILELDYAGIDGKPTPVAPSLCAAEKRSYDALDDLTSIACFGVDGKPRLTVNNGAAVIRNRFDAKGEEVEQDMLGVDGKPIVSPVLGYASAIRHYDDRGNVIEQDAFGLNGKPIAQANGAARVVMAYDDRNLLIRTSYFGIDGKPVLSSDKGIAVQSTIYDARGDPGSVVYFGIDGKPVRQKGRNYYGLVFRYDAAGIPVRGCPITDVFHANHPAGMKC